MQRITILSTGRLKEPFYLAAAKEYGKRLSRYVKLAALEAKDEKAPERLSIQEMDGVKRKEAEALLSLLPPGCFAVALDAQGQRFTSEAFAEFLRQRAMDGRETVFLIGGSLGLHGSALRRADMRLSLSDMTLCHPLARVVLLEQLYRACKINAGEVYHK